MENRINQLLNFLKEDPNDPFTLYCLAMEYEKTDINLAIKYYEMLLQNHEGYTGTYYHAAKLFNNLGEKQKAEEIFKKGLEKTFVEGHTKNYRELQSAYNNFLLENGDE